MVHYRIANYSIEKRKLIQFNLCLVNRASIEIRVTTQGTLMDQSLGEYIRLKKGHVIQGGKICLEHVGIMQQRG